MNAFVLIVLCGFAQSKPSDRAASLTFADDIAACTEIHKRGGGDAEFIRSTSSEKAREWRKAAMAGDPVAMWLWGRCVAEGVATAASPAAAVDWFERSAEAGFEFAMNELGEIHEHGTGVRKNDKLAVKWYAQAVAKGEGLAHSNLAFCYATGRGVAVNHVKARALFQTSADQGYATAHRGLGLMAERGMGMPANPEKAERHFRAALDLGYNTAAADLIRVISAQRNDAASLAEIEELKAAAAKGPPPPEQRGDPPPQAPAASGLNRPKRDTAAMPKRGAKPPTDDTPPTVAGIQPLAGVKRRPDGTTGPNLPNGYNGPAPAFAGKWAGQLMLSRGKEKVRREFSFDADGKPVYKGRVLETYPSDLPTSLGASNGTGTVFNKLTYLSVSHKCVCYSVRSEVLLVSTALSTSLTWIERVTFVPVPGDPNKLQAEVFDAQKNVVIDRAILERVE